MEIEVDLGEGDVDEPIAPKRKMDADKILARNGLRVVYQTYDFFLPQIRGMANNRELLNLRPEYQRRNRWSVPRKSKLIESMLLNIPIPPVYFYEVDEARYEVMDGQQRLSAISDFFAGKFPLKELSILGSLNGQKYEDCSPRVHRTLERSSISAIVLLLESEVEVSADENSVVRDIRRLVFNRLNTGGRALNPQEIRNALNPGPLNDCLVKLSRYDLFTEVFGIPPYTGDEEENLRNENTLYSAMRDCEIILRFLALRNPENIRGSMKSMLDRAMETKFTEEKASEFESDFKSRFEFLYKIFDGSPFMISQDHEKKKISVALYQAAMVAMDQVWDKRDKIGKDKIGVQKRLNQKKSEENSYGLLTGRENTAKSLKERIDLLRNILLPG